MSKLVYCTSESLVSDQQGGVRLLVPNEPFSSDDPIVKAYPGMFADFPDIRDSEGNVIEATTANPGEKRDVRRG